MTEETHVEGFGTLPVLDLGELRREASLDAARMAKFHRSPELVRLADRAFRAERRAANQAPLSAKVVHRGGRVDAGPKGKPKAKSK